ncbi:Protein NBR1-like protein [Dichanthelium oligosanthes]|uniref:Protein NBR1-like protein n=1 Tax=Dichanthelium oligosanthes TaxID=888268 RepID=A0A1E5WI89_9POAL|nr:Protein NBR1-like protein [Dichanthelium oligosanthes]
MSDRSSPAAPTFFPFGPQAEAWDVTFKVKYGDTLKRFYGCVNGAHFDMNLSALRAKITTAFKFGPDSDFILTYTDEDGDTVMLDDDDDLRDAALRQKLNPLRITVQLKGSRPTEQKERSSTPVKPSAQDPLSQIMSAIEGLKPAQEESLAHIKSAIGEAIKSIPEPIPDALAKLSHEVLDAAPPPLAELMKPFVQMMAPSNSGKGPSSAHADGSSSSSSGVTETQAPAKAKDEPKAKGRLGLRSVLEEAAPPPAPSAGASQGQQSSMYPSVEDLLFPSNLVDKSVCKGKNDAQSKGKSVMSSGTQPAPHAVPIHAQPPPPPCVSEWFRPRRCQPQQWQSEDNAKATSDSRWRIPMYKVPYAPPAAVPHAPPGYGPSPHFPYPGRLLSTGHPYGDVAGNMENSAQRSLHRWIQCDGCGVQPIVGPRYKSNVREDYDLCDSCFQRMGNEVEYTKIDKPILPHRLLRDPHSYRKVHHPRVLMKSKREKLESRFILDVTVLDGTLMTPSTSFTKIWRMHNNGSVVWPLGTQLIWVGGDQFALQTSVPLEIPVNGFPVDKEIDVAVDFVAPTRPGRYISYWRLASPSGQKFGQRVWVHIQVEDPSFVNDNNRNAAINLNLPPESNSANTTNLIDVNIEPVDSALSAHAKRTKEFHFYPIDVPETKKSQQIDLNKEILRQNNYNLEQSVDDLCGVNEWDPLLAELEEMGFDDTEMNKELLAKNGGSIKRAVMDLIAREKKDK